MHSLYDPPPTKQAAQGSGIPKASEGFSWVHAHIPMKQSEPVSQMCLLPAHLFDSPLNTPI